MASVIALGFHSKLLSAKYPVFVHFAFLCSLFVRVVAWEAGAVIFVPDEGNSAIEIRGQYAQIGGLGDAVGDIRVLARNCTKSTQPLADPSAQTDEWIGLIYLPAIEETIKEQGGSQRTRCSLLDQVKNAMLLGASALIVLAMNPALLKELDVEQLFKQPVVVVQDALGITKMRKTAHQGKAEVNIRMIEPAKQSHYWSTARLTLWSTCGRSSGGTYKEWEGVVCLGSSAGHSQQKGFPSLWTTLLTIAGTLFLIILHGKWITWGEHEYTEDMENCLQRLAKSSLSKMPARKYKRKRYLLSRERESCAICLEEFIPGKMIRVLPCYHQFHCKCVDFWLITQRTCPLCKLNIVDRLTKSSEGQVGL